MIDLWEMLPNLLILDNHDRAGIPFEYSDDEQDEESVGGENGQDKIFGGGEIVDADHDSEEDDDDDDDESFDSSEEDEESEKSQGQDMSFSDKENDDEDGFNEENHGKHKMTL